MSLDEKCKKLEETIQRVATNTIGYTRKQANKEWFDEECVKRLYYNKIFHIKSFGHFEFSRKKFFHKSFIYTKFKKF
jgi:hypothetical protein